MKNFYIILVGLTAHLFFSAGAFADPGSSNYLSELGEGTVLEVLKDITVAANTSSIYFMEGQAGSGAFSPKVCVNYCRIQIRSRTPKNRIVRKGTKIVVGAPYGGYVHKVSLTSPSEMTRLECDKYTNDKACKMDSNDWTIGALERQMNGLVKIIYPEPDEIQ